MFGEGNRTTARPETECPGLILEEKNEVSRTQIGKVKSSS